MALRAVAQANAAAAAITSGTIDGATIGATAPAAINATDVVVKTLGWSATGALPADINLLRESAGVLSVRNGTNPQNFGVYNTYTDASNYEYGGIVWNGNALQIGSFRAGTGTGRLLNFMVSGNSQWQITTAALFPTTNGAHSVGRAAQAISKLYVDYTNTGTVGAVTINKAAGRVNIAAAGTSVVVTNSVVTAASHVMAVISTNDTTAVLKNVVPAAGSFTITLSAAATAQTSIDFFVINAD